MRNLLITIFIISATWSCRTTSRTVTKEKVSIDSSFYEKKEIDLKNDSSYFTLKENSTINSLINLLYQLNVKYQGSTNDSTEITLSQTTPNEIKLKIKGKAEADFSTSANSTTSQNSQIKTDSGKIKQNKNENSNIKGQVNVDKSKTDKEMEVKSISVPFWIYLFGFLLLALIVALYWFFGRPKK